MTIKYTDRELLVMFRDLLTTLLDDEDVEVKNVDINIDALFSTRGIYKECGWQPIIVSDRKIRLDCDIKRKSGQDWKIPQPLINSDKLINYEQD